MYSVGNPASFYTDIECALSLDAVGLTGITYLKFSNLDFRYWGKCVLETGGDNIVWDSVNLSYIGGADFQNSHTIRYGNGLQIGAGRHDVTIEYCNISNVADAGISPQGNPVSGGFIVYNLYMIFNTIDKCEYGFEFFEEDSSSTAHDIYFENNTVTNSGGGWEHNQRAPAGNVGAGIRIYQFNAVRYNIYIRNNIIYNATNALWFIRTNTLNGPTGSDSSDLYNMTIDYNDEYQPISSVGIMYWVNWNSQTYTSLPLWRLATNGQELHSISADPLFVSSSNFNLQPCSPCINAGLNVGQPFIGSAPEIGAYEFSSGILCYLISHLIILK